MIKDQLKEFSNVSKDLSEDSISEKMLPVRGPTKDKVLFRILKNKSTSASTICGKLNDNVKNITLLSEDELCELWQHLKSILLEAQKLYKKTSDDHDRYTKEHIHMIKLIRTITAMGLETIIQRLFIPNVLLQNIMLLHSILLPNIREEQAKNEISHLLENWWKLDMAWKDKVIVNALKYLIANCASSVQHLKRLYELRSAIPLLKCEEHVQILLKLVRETTVMSLDEGRMLMLHLFTLGEEYILGIHNNVRVALQDIEHNHIAEYANLYIAAWMNATEKYKNFIVENCLENIIFHCFRAQRDSKGRRQLGKNLLSLLAAMHNSKHQEARLMIHEQCKPLVWKHLQAPGSFIKCNAIEIFFITNTVLYSFSVKDRKKMDLQRFYKTISSLLTNTDSEVCNVAMNGIFKMLKEHWSSIPTNIIRDWLNIFLDHTKKTNDPRIRTNIFIGIKSLMVKDRSHRIIRDFLPNFANSIYDDDKMVLEALIKLLWHAQNQLGIQFWDIVPLSYILHRIETLQDTHLLRELMKLVWVRFTWNREAYEKMSAEMVYVGLNNINAIRMLCFHSKSIVSWDTSLKLIEAVLSTIKVEVKRSSLAKTLKKSYNKRARLSKMGSMYSIDYSNICDIPFDSYRDVQIYIDIIAMLLVANGKNIREEKFSEQETNIFQEIANELPQFFKHFRDTSVNESLIFLFSLIPSRFFLNKIEIIEILVKQLCDADTCDDTLLTIVYALMKWDKAETILFALTNLVTQSLNTNAQRDEVQLLRNKRIGHGKFPNNAKHLFQDHHGGTGLLEINEKPLNLSLRILKHLLHAQHQPVLMAEHHEDVLKFWRILGKLKICIENRLSSESNAASSQTKDTVVDLFKQYISLISLLHKKDVFDASEQFSEIVLWIKGTVVPHISGLQLDADITERHQMCIDLIISTLDVANMLVKEYDCTPKLCCDIVLLYCSCLSPASGIIFFNNAFEAIMLLLDFGQMAYKKQEPSLLNIVIPNFVCVTIVTLARHSKDTLIKYTNNLKVLQELTQKYFTVMRNTVNDKNSCLPFITIMFNTAISSVSAEMTRILEYPSVTRKQIIITKFPYLARKIFGILLNNKKYRNLSIQVLSKTITSFARIDMLSALVVIHKIINASDKTVINRLKNITLALKVYNGKQYCDTPSDRSVNRAMNIVMDAILIE